MFNPNFQSPQSNPEKKPPTKIEKKIENIDLTSIKDIFADLLKKSGVEEDRVTKISSDFFEENSSILGSVFNDGQYDYKKDKALVSKFSFSKPDEFLALIVHELTHAISDVQIDESGMPRVGLYEAKFDHKVLGFLPWFSKYNTLLNEGLTQLLAEAVTNEYLRRRGENSSEELQNYTRNVYISGKAVVELLTKSISYRTGVPEDVVFKALVRSMLNYDYAEFVTLVEDDPFLKELVEKIKNLNITELESGGLVSKRKEVNMEKLKVEGLEEVFKSIVTGTDTKDMKVTEAYFNPLDKNLNK